MLEFLGFVFMQQYQLSPRVLWPRRQSEGLFSKQRKGLQLLCPSYGFVNPIWRQLAHAV